MSTPKDDRAGITQIVRALDKAGWIPTRVDYGDGEYVIAHGVPETVDEVVAVDDAFVIVQRGTRDGWVRFVLGNDPDEVVCDYTVNLEDVIGPITKGWWS